MVPAVGADERTDFDAGLGTAGPAELWEAFRVGWQRSRNPVTAARLRPFCRHRRPNDALRGPVSKTARPQRELTTAPTPQPWVAPFSWHHQLRSPEGLRRDSQDTLGLRGTPHQALQGQLPSPLLQSDLVGVDTPRKHQAGSPLSGLAEYGTPVSHGISIVPRLQFLVSLCSVGRDFDCA